MSSKDFSADIIQIMPGDEVKTVSNLDTEGNEVYSACLLFGSQHGISMPKQPNEESEVQTLILGCNNGFVYKFEKADENAPWTKSGQV